jgi:hypothetical protein
VDEEPRTDAKGGNHPVAPASPQDIADHEHVVSPWGNRQDSSSHGEGKHLRITHAFSFPTPSSVQYQLVLGHLLEISQ